MSYLKKCSYDLMEHALYVISIKVVIEEVVVVVVTEKVTE